MKYLGFSVLFFVSSLHGMHYSKNLYNTSSFFKRAQFSTYKDKRTEAIANDVKKITYMEGKEEYGDRKSVIKYICLKSFLSAECITEHGHSEDFTSFEAKWPFYFMRDKSFFDSEEISIKKPVRFKVVSDQEPVCFKVIMDDEEVIRAAFDKLKSRFEGKS